MATPYRVYGRHNAGSWVIQVALEEAGAPYEIHWFGMEPAEVERLRGVVPTGKVPGLVLPDGTSMFESAAMLIYLAAVYPHTGLAPPPGNSDYARFLQWLVFLSANVYDSAIRVYYAERYTTDGQAGAEAVRKQATVDMRGGLELIAAHLNPYVLGSSYSIADAYLYMLASWWPDDKDELFAQLPVLKAHSDLIAARPAARKAHAAHAS